MKRKGNLIRDGTKVYHKECYELKDNILKCAKLYATLSGDVASYPKVIRIVTCLVTKNLIPIPFIKKKIRMNWKYYMEHSVFTMYHIRAEFWEHELRTGINIDRKRNY